MSVHAKNFLTMGNTTRAPHKSHTAERSGLVADALRLGGRLRLRVHGESMLPTLWPGDVVEIAACSTEDIRPGEIVLAQCDGRLFLHRMVSQSATGGFLLRGDSMPGSDPRFSPEALLGRLVGTTEDGRDFSANPISRLVGFLFCHFGLARRFALKIHSRREESAPEFRNSKGASTGTMELGI